MQKSESTIIAVTVAFLWVSCSILLPGEYSRIHVTYSSHNHNIFTNVTGL